MNELDNTNVSALLGRAIAAPRTYDKSILVREPRQSNRKHLEINDHALPFVGYDVWNAWEISTLTDGGVPVTAIGKMVYPASSLYIVESKSLKLYFNSFNMSYMGPNPKSALEKMRVIAEADLSELLGVPVSICFFPANRMLGTNWIGKDGCGNIDWIGNDGYVNIDDYVENCVHYQETPDLLLEASSSGSVERQYLWSTLLKSNCRVTKQSDWGDVFIYIKGIHPIDKRSLATYIVSFRDECHFHEEITETIYKRLWDKFWPKELMVLCTYVRRGGIDINPARASHLSLIPDSFWQTDCPFFKGPRQ